MGEPNRPNMMDRLREGASSVKDIAKTSAEKMKEGVSSTTDKLKNSVSSNTGIDVEALLPTRSQEQQPQREKSVLEQAEEEVCGLLPSLTWQQRVVGCVTCMCVGYVVSFGSFIRFKDLLLGNPVPFVAVTTIGNILSLGGSCFLTGPTNQARRMFHKSRRIATIVYIGSLVLTLVVAFALHGVRGQGPMLILLILAQYVSIAWYCLSYIPFARQAIKRMLNRFMSDFDDGVI